jgi:hypothetical protein
MHAINIWEDLHQSKMRIRFALHVAINESTFGMHAVSLGVESVARAASAVTSTRPCDGCPPPAPESHQDSLILKALPSAAALGQLRHMLPQQSARKKERPLPDTQRKTEW